MKETNVVFDFGNVIAAFDADALAGRFCSGKEEAEQLKTAVFSDWSLLDAGKITYGAYINHTLQKLPEQMHEAARRLFRDWYKYLPYTKGIEQTIDWLIKEGYSLYLLSNAPAYFSQHLNYYTALRGFSGFVVSGDIQKTKPEEEIYQYLFQKYSLSPDTCVFFDDLPANVAAARRLGMRAVQFLGDVSQIKTALMEEHGRKELENLCLG